MMHSAKGSISLPCLLAALLLALSAQLCLLYAVKGYEAEKDFLRGQQLRLLCGSVLQAIGQKPQPAGEQLCYGTFPTAGFSYDSQRFSSFQCKAYSIYCFKRIFSSLGKYFC